MPGTPGLSMVAIDRSPAPACDRLHDCLHERARARPAAACASLARAGTPAGRPAQWPAQWPVRARTRLAATLLGLAALAGLALAPAPAAAQEMVSIRGEQVNMRAGPGTQSEVLWELGQGYPLRVLERRGSWVQVVDFEGDRGWVARSLTGRTPHHVVKSRTANLRSGPGTQYRVVGQADYGEVLRTREKRAGWVRVEREGGQAGWVARRLLWGW